MEIRVSNTESKAGVGEVSGVVKGGKVPNQRMSSSGIEVTDRSFMNVIENAGMHPPKTNIFQFGDIISNFVSKTVRQFCINLENQQELKKSEDGTILIPEIKPSSLESFAAVVMVDVSGYSKLTAALAERGPVGAELLSQTMKGYLDQIIEVIVSYGGDIVKFAGDAVIVCWKSDTAVNLTDNREDIERGELVYKAAYCCLTLLTKLGTYEINIADCPTKTLRIHLGIGAGLVSDVFVGGFPGRWEHFLAGDGVNQLSQVLDLAKAGELAMSHQALKWLVYVVDIRTLNLGDYDKKCIILTGLMEAKRRVPPPMEAELEFVKINNDLTKTRIVTMNKLFMDRTALFKLQSDVHQSNLFQLDAGLLELLCLTELRQITTIFIKIGSLQGADKDELLEQAQNAIQAVQNALMRCDGSLRQFHVDDKGAVILCFFGLPPLAHENNSKLGISAGIEIREKFLDLFEEFSIGITTGVVSFGGVGAQGRAEYAVMGDAINMAARLMCHKDAKRGILCDQKTFNLCENDFEFEGLGETTVKGKPTPIAIFRPVFAVLETEKNLVSAHIGVNLSVLGREKEKKAIFSTLDQLTNSPTVNNLFFSAEGGQGLNTLANYAKAEALKQNCHFCTGKGVQIEQNNSFFVFRSLVCDMVQLLDIGAHNAFGQFKIPNQNHNAIHNKQIEQSDSTNSDGGANAVFTVEKKRRSTFVNKPTVNKPMGKSYTIMELQAETNNEEELFSLRFRMALEILDCNENQAALLELVTQSHDDESDAIAQAHLRLHAKDLCDILTRLLHTLTANNKIIIMITEAHYLDTLSWDLLLELAAACPRLAIFSFSRPESSIESHENKRIYRLIEQLRRTKSYFVQGLSESETTQLIMLIWSGNTITSIDPTIAESIYKRTNGNPFFIRSLIVALKESGQWRVNNNGRLTTPADNFDYDKLVLGYDNQSIVLAQFDRLDRNFQLFLKIASFLGQRFSLDDILFFLTGVEDASQITDHKKYMLIISGIRNTDKYGFLQKHSFGPDGAYMGFKSAIVMKCVYSMMVNNQRQQLHLLVARYLERKINEQNRHRYGVQILEHYQNCNSIHKKKLVQYTEMAAKYFFEKDSPSDSIKYNKRLLELIEGSAPGEFSDLSSLQIANYHRELGYSLMMNNELDDAENHLISSLRIMGYALPPPGLKFKLALKRLEATRKKLDLKFFKDRAVPQEQDYTQSYVAKKGASGYSLSNLAPAMNTKKPECEDVANISSQLANKLIVVSPAQQVIRDTRESIVSATQHALVTLAQVFFKKGDFKGHYYAILLGLNISSEKSIEGHMSRLFSLGALALRHINTSSKLALQYMEASITFDLRVDIHTSLQQVSSNATLLFLSGTLEACHNKLEVVSYLSTMAGELTSRVYGLNLKCLLQLHSTSSETALATAKDLYNISFQRESRVGKLWGCYHIIHNLLGQIDDPESVLDMQTKMKEMLTLWTDFNGSREDQNYLPLNIGVIVMGQLVSIFTNEEPDIAGSLEKILPLVSNVPFYQWQFFAAMNPLALLILYAIHNTDVGPSLAKLIDQVCEAANLSLKSTKALVLANNIRRIFKGIRLKIKRKDKPAVKAWKKGMGSQEEDLYTHAILSSSILASEPGENAEETAQDLIKELKAKGRFQKIFPVA